LKLEYKEWREKFIFVLLYLLITVLSYLCSQFTPLVQIRYFMWFVDLQTSCAKYGLETWFSPNYDIRKCLLDMQRSWTKNAFWDMNNKKWRKWCKFVSPFLFNNTYGSPVITMVTKCSNQVFYVWMVDLHTICAKYWLLTWLTPNNDIRKCLFVMQRCWIKNAFWVLNNKKWRKWYKFVSPFLFNNPYDLPVLTMDTKRPNQVFYVCLVDLQGICSKYVLETWFSPNDDIRICLRDMQRSWNKNAFWNLNSKKWRKWCILDSPFFL
jgi:hypothetical protein